MKLLGVLVSLGCAGASLLSGLAAESEDGPVPTAEIDLAIVRATHYIVGACGPDGKFWYEVRVADGAVSRDYNIVRHAGAMYALALADGLARDPAVTAALERAGRYLRARAVEPGPLRDGEETLAVWTAGAPPSGEPKATLGATGLGLVGLLGLEEAAPGATVGEELRRLGQFLLFMQAANGRFHSKYLPRDGGRFSRWGSLYYPGEAALALLGMAERDPAGPWRNGAERALGYLAKSREGAAEVPPDNWALIATAKLLAMPATSQTEALREPLILHAERICERFLAEQIEGSAGGRLDGGFERNGRTTPTATRLEGLLATLEFLPPDRAELRRRIAKAVHRGMRFLLRAQIRTGPYAGGMPPSVAATDPVIRIDFVQHFLDALVRYREMFGAEEWAPVRTFSGGGRGSRAAPRKAGTQGRGGSGV